MYVYLSLCCYYFRIRITKYRVYISELKYFTVMIDPKTATKLFLFCVYFYFFLCSLGYYISFYLFMNLFVSFIFVFVYSTFVFFPPIFVFCMKIWMNFGKRPIKSFGIMHRNQDYLLFRSYCLHEKKRRQIIFKWNFHKKENWILIHLK